MGFIQGLNLEKDLPAMDYYIQNFGSADAMPVEKYLSHWYEAKSQYLLPIFQNQLIHKKTIHYTKNYENIEYDLNRLLFDSDFWNNLMDSIFKMLKYVLYDGDHWKLYAEINTPSSNFYRFIRDYFFFDPTFFINNSIDISSSLAIGPGCGKYLNKTITIQNKQKPFRVINNILKNLEPICRQNWPAIFTNEFFSMLYTDIETCRIIHSQVLNSSDITGDLCLSIHPFDYITMSDNSYNWESCMTWTREGDPGEYRIGTLEMMNSPCVVVAYIEGKEPFEFGEYKWNNKKWRELFIVDKNFISGIRAYPYQITELEETILKELAEMAEKINFSHFEREIKETTPSHTLQINNFSYKFTTHLMYNDYECHTCHYLIAQNPILNKETKIDYYCYSGVAYCLECNDPLTLEEMGEDTEFVTCNTCRGVIKCNCCGDYIHNNLRYINGEPVCSNCAVLCNVCGNYVYADEADDFAIIDRFDNYYYYDACPSCFKKLDPYLIKKNYMQEKISSYCVKKHYFPPSSNILLPTITDEIYESFATSMPSKEFMKDIRDFRNINAS